MASRSRTTFKKRQKEIARMEKQRAKMAKRMERKLVSKQAHESGVTTDELDLTGEPLGAAEEENLPDV
jgi:hypothetical protein